MPDKNRILLFRSLLTFSIIFFLSTGPGKAQDIINGLAGYYTFCNCTGTDFSGNNRNGTISGSPRCLRGILDYGFLFNQNPGANGCGQPGGEYISLPAITPIWSAGFTVCAWVKFDEIKNYERIIDFSNGNGEGGGLPIWFGREGNSNNLTLESWIDANAGQARTTGRLVAANAITNGSIEYYCATTSGDTMRIYVNGILVAQKIGNPIANVTRRNNFIGHSAWCNNDPDFKGFMDEVRIYNRALSAAEIQSLYRITNVTDFQVAQVCKSTLANFKVDSLPKIDSIKWNFGDVFGGSSNTATGFSVSHNFPDTGTYMVQAIAYKTCLNDTVTKQVRIADYKNFLGPDFSLCRGSHTKKLSIPGASYLWQDGSNLDSFVITVPGAYRLQVTVNGCLFNDTVIVTTNKKFSTLKWSMCEGNIYSGHSLTGVYTDTLPALNGCDSIRTLELTVLPKSLSTINHSICKGESYFGYSAGGTYRDTFAAANGCDSLRVINLTVATKPEPHLGSNTTVCAGDNIILAPGKFASYLWQDGTTQDIFTVNRPGIYSVTVTNACGTARDEITISEENCDSYFPTSFSPNRDGKNDVFKILRPHNIQEYYLVVYNRWGQNIFETKDYTHGWDGTFKGIRQDANVFVWTCAYKSAGKVAVVKKGTVYLMR